MTYRVDEMAVLTGFKPVSGSFLVHNFFTSNDFTSAKLIYRNIKIQMIESPWKETSLVVFLVIKKFLAFHL